MTRSLFYLLFIISSVSFSQVQIGQTISGEVATSDFLGTSISLSDNGQIIAIGGTGNNNTDEFLGHVNVFILDNGNWVRLGNQIVPSETAFRFGSSVSMSGDGNTLVVGAPQAEVEGQGTSGKTFVYEYNGSQWVQKGTTIEGSLASQAGTSVDISNDGDRIVIGLPISSIHGQTSGEIEIYNFENNEWFFSEFAPNPNPLEEFGTSVSMSSDGNFISVGSIRNPLEGLVRVFTFSSGQWFQFEGGVTGDGITEGFGRNVSISGNSNRIAVGVPFSNNDGGSQSGAIKIYERQNSNWIQIGQDINGMFSGENVGISIELSDNGNLVTFSTRFDELHIYGFINDTWVQIGTTIESTEPGNNAFSSSAISGDGTTIAIGSPSINASNSIGITRVFDISSLLALESFELLNNAITLQNDFTKKHILIYKDGQLLNNSTYEIYAASGAKIKEDVLTNGILSTAYLSSGIYFIKLNIGATTITRKFITK